MIYCRGLEGSADASCQDRRRPRTAVQLAITDVRYWGYPTERWHLPFLPDGDLAAQVAHLARTLNTDDLA